MVAKLAGVTRPGQLAPEPADAFHAVEEFLPLILNQRRVGGATESRRTVRRVGPCLKCAPDRGPVSAGEDKTVTSPAAWVSSVTDSASRALADADADASA